MQLYGYEDLLLPSAFSLQPSALKLAAGRGRQAENVMRLCGYAIMRFKLMSGFGIAE